MTAAFLALGMAMATLTSIALRSRRRRRGAYRLIVALRPSVHRPLDDRTP